MTEPTKVAKSGRRSREELRQLMLSAGRDVLLTLEPTLGFEGLTYSAVFAHLQTAYDQKVTIGSVHERLWSSQREFQLAVIADALSDPVTPATTQMLERSVEVLNNLDLDGPADRRYAIQTACRLSSRNLLEYEHDDVIRLVYTLRLRLWELGRDHPEAARIAETISAIRQRSMESYAEIVRVIMKHIGLRVRSDAGDPDQAILDVALLGNASRVGLETDALASARTQRQYPTGPNGENEAWYLDALALWAVVRNSLELDGEGLTPAERRL